ncbi:serine/threonine-protein kinase, partial [Pirellulales bacterium]|nr:serine/threonine-protein kinase [Pirellulales bacterium]
MKPDTETTRVWPSRPSAEVAKTIDDVCDRFEQAWKTGDARLEDHLDEAPGDAPDDCREHLLRELASIELHYRRDAEGRPLTRDALIDVHPQIGPQLRTALERDVGLDGERGGADPSATVDADRAEPAPPGGSGSRELHIRCPHCREPVELLADTPLADISCRGCGSTFSIVDQETTSEAAPSLQAIGRFELLARVGVGGFGTVWKARDTELDRMVALKIPRRGNLRPHEIDHFFREARAAAQLPNIVPVHEIGREDDTVFIVSDFVRGTTLSEWMNATPPTVREIAELGATIADALHHAHEHGVIHRDLKPSNIMIDEAGRPYLMDFGLAKRQVGEITMTVEGQILGTAAYMSPEQAA